MKAWGDTPGATPVSGAVNVNDRGVSPVVGAILMFALALAVLAILQTTAIPALNAQLEFQHNEQVQTDFLEFNSAVDRTISMGGGHSVRIESGLRYPPRLFFVNPPPVTGTVRTSDPAAVEVTNATAAGETGDYWNGTPRGFESRSLEYSANYHEYANGPTTVYEPWVVYNRFDESTLPLTNDSFVDGRQITLVMLKGTVATSSTRSVPLSIKPTSAPAERVLVRDDGGPITLTVPTQLSADEWASILADELDPDGDSTNDRYVTEFDCQQSPPEPCGRLTITLEQGVSYELRLGAVSLGGNGTEPEGTYLVDIAGDETSVPENGTRKLVVETRDRFDNPVSGVTVNASLDGDGTLRSITPVTGTDGHAVFVYEAPEEVTRSTDVEVTANFGGARPREQVTFNLRVMDIDGSNRGNNDPTVNITTVADDSSGSEDRYNVTVDVEDSEGDLDRVEFELRDPTTGEVLDTASADVNGGTATVTESLGVRRPDRLGEYRIVVEVFDAFENNGTDERTVDGSG